MRNQNLQAMVKIALFTALIGALGYISIPLPFSPVPITGQTLAILLAGFLLTVPQAAASVGLWAFMGVIGLPVFSQGRAGLSVLMGPSGGYIIGFFLCAVLIAFLRGKESVKNAANPLAIIARYSAVGFVGSFIVIYTCGVIGLMVVTKMPLAAAVAKGMVPFLIGDTLKLIIAVMVAFQVKRSAPDLFPN